ncbi:autotransporter outer membrane beta-barrel domain-containing protein [Roseicella aquatilis]|uniref:Autotransporter domain-containing protein n=1 Tax=Roseicella aquatilis TaxID=2527868 RepID=A0A4R4D515_9PROT|nr:autotransporter outer membrane beta-barrel domain-containing protein [Roseicella aquatilis]TCZ54225.1 hypothetical protein EXY23_23610 [Roseicella aquatilis]
MNRDDGMLSGAARRLGGCVRRAALCSTALTSPLLLAGGPAWAGDQVTPPAVVVQSGDVAIFTAIDPKGPGTACERGATSVAPNFGAVAACLAAVSSPAQFTSSPGQSSGSVSIVNNSALDMTGGSSPSASPAMAGIVGAALGGNAGPYSSPVGTGGAVSITNWQKIAVVPGTNFSTFIPLIGAGSQNWLAFGGGILGISTGGVGEVFQSSQSKDAHPYVDLTTGGTASAVTITSGTDATGARVGVDIWTGATTQFQRSFPGMQFTFQTVNPGIFGWSRGGDSACQLDSNGLCIGIGQGGPAGAVTIQAVGNITTQANNSGGIVALSQGGGGSVSSSNTAGGAGGSVSVGYLNGISFPNTIATSGANSPAITAISAGGDVIGVEQQGRAGSGGPVSVQVDPGLTLRTSGEFSPGIVAGSLSGALQSNIAQIKNYSNAPGNSSAVTVTNSGIIQVTGSGSDGIVAQSLGGGGGTAQAGNVSDSYNLGAGTGAQSVAANVTVNNSGAITVGTQGNSQGTAQDSASAPVANGIGIVAQSIVGGGGIAYLVDTAQNASVNLGANTGSGNSSIAGQVSVSNSGPITTWQAGGVGILAQSIAGGGGNAKSVSGLFRHGGTGGEGGNGGAVFVLLQNVQGITTAGWQAHGIVAQSLGGGGGAGGPVKSGFSAVGGAGGSGGNGGTVQVTTMVAAAVTTTGDDSIGILAQSVGGGGGAGGKGTAWGLIGAAGVGGAGGNGGSGGAVTVNLGGALSTGLVTGSGDTLQITGAHGYGILAQSVGGGGGTGGAGQSKDISLGLGASVAVGAGGAGGGGGGQVSVALGINGQGSGATLSTVGPDAYGILAQSIGGGGGAGGQARARSFGAITLPDVPSLSVATAVGAMGGGGGAGGTVQVTTWNPITSRGQGAVGILAQSIGGGGGTGGDSTAMATTVFGAAGSAAISVATSVGAHGGNSGSGGTVTVTANAPLTTGGDYAHGIHAQSIGGGGGTGGIGDALPRTPKDTASLNVGVAVGGSAGNAANGGQVTVNTGAAIATAGHGAHGVFAQSIGGGGGAAEGGGTDASTGATGQNGKINMNVAVGGNGGGGGNGGAVTVGSGGTTTTTGAQAFGILAQSVGGGGGLGGSAMPSDDKDTRGTARIAEIANEVYGHYSDKYTKAKDNTWGQFSSFPEVNLTTHVGGTGGSGGSGSSVLVNQTTGSIATSGALAHGIVAQSIGGGGGVGGAASLTGDGKVLSTDISVNAGLTLGGSGGSAGDGRDATVNLGSSSQAASIATSGVQALGIVAQSIGGGGGLSGSAAIISGGKVTLGAGNSGNGGAGGSGGTVSVSTFGTLATLGADSLGILAQSIGGGGGAVGTAGSTRTAKRWAPSYLGTVMVNGSGGAAGNGGAVTVGVNSLLSTAGDRAIGVLAQSIGSGGGLIASGSASGSGTGGSAIQIGQNISTTNGNGAPVAVTVGGAAGGITTQGAGAHAIVAQSIGGGGGLGGDTSLAPGLGLPAGTANNARASGNGANVSVTVNNVNVSATGANAHGIVAQSLGGGGGIVDGRIGRANGTGTAGNVSVTINGGTVGSASGYGIAAQSMGSPQGGRTYDSSGNVTIGITGGAKVSGGLAGIAIDASDGNHTLGLAANSWLCGSNCDDARGTPFTLINGNMQLQVSNAGIISGTVNAPGAFVTTEGSGTMRLRGANAFGSLTMQSGSWLDVTNYTDNLAGVTLNVANPGQNSVTLADGANIVMPVDFLNGRSNQLQGNNLQLGNVIMYYQATNLYPVWVTIANFQGGLISASATSLQSVSDLVYSYRTNAGHTGTGYTAAVAPFANYTPTSVSLTANQSQVAQAVQAAWNIDAGGQSGTNTGTRAQRSATYTSLYGKNAGTYGAALDQFHAQGAGAHAATLMAGGAALAGTLHSCPDFAGPDTLLRENSCVWMRTVGRLSDTTRTAFGGSASASAVALQIGGQYQFAPNWFLGGVFSNEQTWMHAAGGLEKVSTMGQSGGVILKHQMGVWQVSASLLGGYADGSSTRQLPAFGTAFSGSPGADFVLGRLRVAREFVGERVYARPSLDLDVIRLGAWGYDEQGSAAGQRLRIRGGSTTLGAVTPQVEFGARWSVAEGMTLRPTLTLGVTALSEDSIETRQELMGQAMRIRSPLPGVTGRMALGMDLLHRNGFELRAQYALDRSADITGHTGTLRAGLRF